VALLKGYKVKVVIPEYYSVERRITLLALGAEIVVTAADKGVAVGVGAPGVTVISLSRSRT
jgi:cysteine synthase